MGRVSRPCGIGCVSGEHLVWHKAGYSTGKCICLASVASFPSCVLLQMVSEKPANYEGCRPFE